MRFIRIVTIGLLVITLVSSITYCTPHPDYPEGSVISQEITWLDEHYQNYEKVDIAVTVQNSGGAGLIGMKVYCIPNASDSTAQVLVLEESGEAMETGTIHLEEGEQGTLHFYFWAYGQIDCDIQFSGYGGQPY